MSDQTGAVSSVWCIRAGQPVVVDDGTAETGGTSNRRWPTRASGSRFRTSARAGHFLGVRDDVDEAIRTVLRPTSTAPSHATSVAGGKPVERQRVTRSEAQAVVTNYLTTADRDDDVSLTTAWHMLSEPTGMSPEIRVFLILRQRSSAGGSTR